MMYINEADPTKLNALADDKKSLRAQASYALSTFLFLGGTITVCRPAVAIGSGFSPNKHPRNRIVGVRSPLTV